MRKKTPDRIFVTRPDFERLSRLVNNRESFSPDRPYLDQLGDELDRAEVVEVYDVAPDVITMNSEVLLKDLQSGEVARYRLVYPGQARAKNNVSILAPIGTAMLGYRTGDIVEWQVPKGLRRFQVLEVLFQPEAVESTVLS
jgi:regulator of nucleoside diphosphate kinase